MPVYLVLAIDIHDHATYLKYLEGARPAMAEYELEMLSADGQPTVYEGTQPAGHLAILKFKSQEEFDRFYHSEAYQKALPFRRASSETRFMMTMKAAS